MSISARSLRRGMVVSTMSIIWTLVSGGTSVVLGIENHSLVLIALGCTGTFDAAGSAALVVHFRHALRHDTFSDVHERVALMVVTGGLVVVALATVAGSVHRLIWGGESGQSAFGLAIAAVSIFVLGALAAAKWHAGDAIPSPALKADGMLSCTGALLGVVTVVGSLLTGHGIEWADPVAALFIAAGALTIVFLVHRDTGSEST